MKFENIDRVVEIQSELRQYARTLQYIEAYRDRDLSIIITLKCDDIYLDNMIIADASRSIVDKVLDMYELELRTNEKELMDELETL